MTILLIANEVDGGGFVFSSDLLDPDGAMALGKLTWSGMHGVEHDVTPEQVEQLKDELQALLSPERSKEVQLGDCGLPVLMLTGLLGNWPVNAEAVSKAVHEAAIHPDDREPFVKARGKGSNQSRAGQGVHRRGRVRDARPPSADRVKPW